MVQQTLTGHFLIFRAGAAIVGIGIDADAATREEKAQHLNVLGIHQANKVFHNDIDAVFMKVAMIAEGEKIELEALRLHHTLTGQVHDLYLGKVWLTSDGTQRSELRTVELHPVVVLRMLVLEGLKQRWVVLGGILGLASKQLQLFVGSWHVL